MDCMVAGVMLAIIVSGCSLSEAKLQDKCLKTGKKVYAAVVVFMTKNACFCLLQLVVCYGARVHINISAKNTGQNKLISLLK